MGQADDVQLRRLDAGDAETAGQACRLFGAEGDLDPAAFLGRPETALIVAEDESGLAGWVYGHQLLHPDGERTMLLYALDVAERARRQGLGKALVTAFVDHAREVQCTEVWVLTDDGNPTALAAYSAAGGRRNPVDQVMFTWKLAEGRHS